MVPLIHSTPRGRKTVISDLDSFPQGTSLDNLAASEEGDDTDSADGVSRVQAAAEALGGMLQSAARDTSVPVPVAVSGFVDFESEPPTRKSKLC